MSETDYNARLYEKMKAEQDKYRDRLLHQEPPEILNHTYEFIRIFANYKIKPKLHGRLPFVRRELLLSYM